MEAKQGVGDLTFRSGSVDNEVQISFDGLYD